jgi:hypothetical protein
VTLHPYERSPHSGAGNCHCGWPEHSRLHPHAYAQMDGSELCVCSATAGNAAFHTDAATAKPGPVRRRGLDGVRDAVKAARGGDAPPQVTGYA